MSAQKEHRQRIDIGPGLSQVSPARCWHKHGYLDNEDEAKGAFRLAYQQGLDGLGESISKWMGLTDNQFDAWMRDEALPH